ncbi:MAG: hypothetical protein PHN93_05380 [Sphaerochaetaceae bacterium]|nr:hypothetical protein [Sphaerochaetaceae bacterium]
MCKNKNIIIIALTIGLMILLFLSLFTSNKFFNQSKISKNDLFKHKQECSSYREDIERLLQKDQEFSLSRKVLDEIFYSPSLNTCLYSYTSTHFNANGKPMDIKVMGEDFVIVDYFTGENIFSHNSAIYNIIQEGTEQQNDLRTIFEEEKLILKK